MIHNINTRSIGIGLALLVVGLAALGAVFGAPVAAQEEPTEIANETLDVDDVEEQVWAEIGFAENGSEVDVELLAPDGTVANSSTVTGDAGDVVEEEFNATETGEHQLVVTGNETAVDELQVGVGDGDAIVVVGSDDDSGALSVPPWVLAIGGIAVAAVVADRQGWLDL